MKQKKVFVVFGTVFAGFFFSPCISVLAADDSRYLLYLPAIISSHGQSAANPPSTVTYGAVHAGQYHLGPVDFAETKWHNACAPAGGYRSELVASAGPFTLRVTAIDGQVLEDTFHEFPTGQLIESQKQFK
jgi:hypothetical protein